MIEYIEKKQTGELSIRTRQLMRQIETGNRPFGPIMAALQRMVDGEIPGYEEMFPSPIQQLKTFRTRNKTRKWKFNKHNLECLFPMPEPSKEWLQPIILDVSLDNPWQTFDQACDCIGSETTAKGDWQFQRHEDFTSSYNIGLRQSVEHTRGVRWVKLDLNANRNKKVSSVIGPETKYAGSAILWAMSYAPQWLEMMDGMDIPYISLPGYITPKKRVPTVIKVGITQIYLQPSWEDANTTTMRAVPTAQLIFQ